MSEQTPTRAEFFRSQDEFLSFLRKSVGGIVEINRWDGPYFYKENGKYMSPPQVVYSSLALLLWYRVNDKWEGGMESSSASLRSLEGPDEWNSSISLRAFWLGHGAVVKLLLDGKPVVMRVHFGDFIKWV
jgi:hypothetical protein